MPSARLGLYYRGVFMQRPSVGVVNARPSQRFVVKGANKQPVDGPAVRKHVGLADTGELTFAGELQSCHAFRGVLDWMKGQHSHPQVR